MRELEPELITVVEGPTPEFRPSPYLWFQSVYEGPEDADVMLGDVLSDQVGRKRSPEDITIVDLTGIAAEDIAIASLFSALLAR